MTMRILTTTDSDEWIETLRQSRQHDFHHLPQYHRVAERNGEGAAHFFVYREADYTVGIPLLLRAVEPEEPAGWQDATSVYGYCGPVASHDELPEGIVRNFQAALAEALAERRVTSVFSRLHPLMAQRGILAGLGTCPANGTTISIDLTLSDAEQRAAYSKNCRTSIRKLHALGFVGLHDREKRYLPQFLEVYRETMLRAGAQSSYFFDEEYFALLTRELGDASHLFVVLKDGEVAAATLCTICNGIVQDHLGGTRSGFLKFSPDRLVVDTERIWATEMGARVFHLGGGVGSQEDSVFRYKAGFSNRRHAFSTWRWVLRPDVYQALVAKKAHRNQAEGLRVISEGYFPAYRCPTVPVAGPEPMCVAPTQSPAMRVLETEQAEEWDRVLARCVQRDFYFLPAYHALAEARGEGQARLFVYENGDYTLALPLLLRPLADVPELAGVAGDWRDATSVYGYAGPVVSHGNIPEPVVRGFQDALRDTLRDLRVVSVFSRLHPLLSQRDLLAGIGECQLRGRTISIDLTLSPEEQFSRYNPDIRRRIARLTQAGAVVVRDEEGRYMGEFVSIYLETMRRVGAEPGYFFDEQYFARLAEALGPALQLFVAVMPGGEVIGGSLFTICDGIMQFHLGGTRDSARKFSPTGMASDGARLWGNERRARVLHLGGGVGAAEDSLFQYKAGFSDRRHDFAIWRWIVQPGVYDSIVEETTQRNSEMGLEAVSADYFPRYRCPVRPRLSAPTPALQARGAEFAVHHG
jgi:hypothetical protein